ncbi:hypothetical protein BS50DRAFT_578362, partial [Corynespora cassiicola Philippines]
MNISVVGVFFETSYGIVSGLYLPAGSISDFVYTSLSLLRAFASFLCLLLLLKRRQYERTDEETMPLLQGSTVCSAQDNNTKGIFHFAKNLAIFRSCILPKNDYVFNSLLAIRVVIILAKRYLNIGVPHTFGTVVDKAIPGSGKIPWNEIGLWAVHYSLRGVVFPAVENSVSTYVEASSFRKIQDLAFHHIHQLSFDFYAHKNSGEIVKAMEQAESVNGLVDTLLNIGQMFLDLAVALAYIWHEFGMNMALAVSLVATSYIMIGVRLAAWSSSRRSAYAESLRKKTFAASESISHFELIAYFNQASAERERYKRIVEAAMTALLSLAYRQYAGQATLGTLIYCGHAAVVIIAIQQIVSGKIPIGSLFTFQMIWENIASPIKGMASSYRLITTALIDAERLIEFLH